MVSKEITMNSIGMNMAFVVQKKSTPFRNPRNSGGSPNGVSDPPILATRNIKKTITCTLCWRCLFARIKGRINNIAAPVVPIQLAKTVPTKIIITFTIGLPTSVPVKHIPPDIVKSDSNKIMKGKYSRRPTWSNSYPVTFRPSFTKHGKTNNTTQNKETLP